MTTPVKDDKDDGGVVSMRRRCGPSVHKLAERADQEMMKGIKTPVTPCPKVSVP